MPTFDLCLRSDGIVLALRWTAIQFIFYNFSGTILYNRFLTLFSSKITAVAINDFILSGKELRHHRYIVNIRRSGFNSMRKPAVLINSDMRFIAEIPYVPLVRQSCVCVPCFL